jgi:flagellar assembly protein FliH
MSSSCKASVFAAAPGAVSAWAPVEFGSFTALFEPAEMAAEEESAEPEIDAAALAAQAAQEAEQDRLLEAITNAHLEWEAEEQVRRETIRAAAYHEGFEAGRVEGERAEQMRLANARRAAEHALDDVRAGETKWAGTIEENVAALAVAVARQLLARELRSEPAALVDLVRRALAEFPIDQPIRIRVNPGDLAALSTVNPAAPITTGREAAWVADAQIAPGGCMVEGRDRIIDGRVDAALERVYRRLTYTHA